jgi:methylthioribose-1-phosphate isomerase
MKVNGQHFRTIWVDEQDTGIIQIIDQRHLPHRFVIEDISTVEQMATAIRDMHLRGAGLIGAAAAYGMYLATLTLEEADDAEAIMQTAGNLLISTRPTAVNLSWAVQEQWNAIGAGKTISEKKDIAFSTANHIAEEDAAACQSIGIHGLSLIETIYQKKKGVPLNILTHCNAGWLAFVDHGSALSPIYAAHEKGIPVHVWVDETRPRNQGASLTAWELGMHGVPHTIIADNAGGHLMQHGMVDMVIVGSDRTTINGDVANKIGTYLKALAAKDNNIPFYVALPSSSIDWQIADGLKEINIELRDGDEVKFIDGLCDGEIKRVLLTPPESRAINIGFDVTPARLVTKLITERGICEPGKKGLFELYPEMKTDG